MRVALGAVLLLAVLATFLLLRDDASERGRSARSREEAAEEARGRDSAAGPDEAGESAKPGRDEKTEAKVLTRLRGYLQDEDKRRIAGGVVVVRNDDETDGPERATSDANGNFELLAERGPWIALRVHHPEFVVQDHYVGPDAEEPYAITLSRGAPLTVVVRKPDLSPAGGAEVHAFALEQIEGQNWYYHVELDSKTTDAEGRAPLGAVPIGSVSLSILHEGFAPIWHEQKVTGLDPFRIDIVLDRGGAVEGTVRTPDGRPVEGARVRSRHMDKPVAVTDGHGRYRLEALPAWGNAIIAEADGYGPGFFGDSLGWGEPLSVEVRSGETVRGIDIVLGAPSYLRGRIADENDEPASGVTVYTQVEPGFASKTSFRTGSDGSFVAGPFALKRSAQVTLRFHSDDYTIPEELKPFRLDPGRDHDVGTIRAQSRASVSGVVYDVVGAPLSKGYVAGEGGSTPTRPDGTFELKGLEAGRNGLVAYGVGKRRNRSRKTVVELEAGGKLTGVELRLVSTLTIEGRVITPEGEPRPGLHLLAEAPDGEPQHEDFEGGYAPTGEDGAFRFKNLLPGRYRIGIGEWTPKGVKLFDEPEPMLVEAGTTGVEFFYPRTGGVVAGRVLSKRTNAPLRKFDVSLFKVVLIMPNYEGCEKVESADGRFAVETEKAGFYAVEVYAEGLAPFRTKPKQVRRGATVDFGEIRLGDAGAVHGRVRDHLGRPVRWTKVRVLSPKLETSVDTTDARGLYEVTGLTPGKYTVFAVSPQHPLAMLRGIDVGEGERVEVDVEFPPSAPLTIRVTDEQGQPLPGAKLVYTFEALKPLDSSMAKRYEPPGYGANVADDGGVIRKPFLPTGEVEIRLSADGFEQVTRTVELKTGQPLEIEVRLPRKP